MKKAKVEITHLIRTVSTIHDVDVDKYFIEVEFCTVGGQRKRTALARGLAPSKALEKLLNEGATLPGATAATLSEVLRAEPDRLRRVTGRTGWHGSSFVLPDVTIGPDASLGYRDASKSEEHVRGSLDDWRSAFALPCLASSYLTFGLALAFAGPLLRLVGQDEGASFYLCGKSSTGKTLSQLGGQSVIGRAVRAELLTHDVTPRALEEAAAAHNDLFMNIDEIDRGSGSEAERRKHVRELTHKLASGGGRKRSARATQDASLANLQWRLFSYWSGEHPLDSRFLGDARERGEMVRLIELPVPKPKKGGIFDRTAGVELSTSDLAKKVEDAVQANFGHPIRAFIRRLADEPQTWTAQAQAHVEEFIRELGAQSDPWTQRFATKFAVVYAAANLAAEMEIAPWPPKHAFKCIARLYRRARNVMATPDEALADLLHRLAANATSKRRFPVLNKGEALHEGARRKAWGFRREASGAPQNLAVHSRTFDKLVRPRRHASQVRQLLAAGGYALPGKEGRLVSQLKVGGFGSSRKPYFIRVRIDRLSPANGSSG